MDSDKTLDKIRDIIIKTVHPDKIILFGSRAIGNYREDSDYDIYIIKSGIDNERVVTRAVYRALLEIEIGTSVDILASSPEKFEKNKYDPYLITSDVNTQGVTLYG